MVEAKQKVTNLSRNLRSMKFMRRGENAIDLDAEASELKTRPEQWFRQVEPIETKIEVQQAAISECMDLRFIKTLQTFIFSYRVTISGGNFVHHSLIQK